MVARLAFTLGATALVAWLLLAGLPLGAAAVAAAAVAVRRTLETRPRAAGR